MRNLKTLLQDPRSLLFLDGVGATMTAIATAYLLAGQRIETGLPIGILYTMAFVALCFGGFDFCVLYGRTEPGIGLRAIAVANLCYCLVTMLFLYLFRSSVTGLGFAYFCIEIPIVVSLAIWEGIVALRPMSNKSV